MKKYYLMAIKFNDIEAMFYLGYQCDLKNGNINVSFYTKCIL